jgi:hemerythrin superfamily protein
MAQRKNAQRNDKQPEDAIAMLKADHKKVKALFDKFESAGDGQTKVKQQIAEEVFMELEIHARLEEEIFYPAFEAAADMEGEKLIAESIEEHHVVTTLMEEMRELDPSDQRYEAKFTVLMENVRHHIEEEEEEMFPEAEDILEDEMDELTEQMQELKQELMAS